MEKFKKIIGIAAPFTRINVDTDLIIPAENLKTISKQGLGKNLFSYIRFNKDGSENKKFILVCQKREPINKRNYEFPSGWVNKGEKPVESASRELLEETGYKSLIKPKKLLTLFPEPGRLSKYMTCYYSNKLKKTTKPERGIKIIYCDKKKIIQLIKIGKFNSASHIAAFYYYLSNKN